MLLTGQGLKPIVLVETLDRLVLGVSDNGHGRNLARRGKRSSKGVQKEASADSLTPIGLIDGQAADERGGINLVAGHPVRETGRKISALDGDSAQRVEAGDPVRRRIMQHPDGSDPLLHLLASPLTEVLIQRRFAAREGRAEGQMLFPERFNAVPLIHRVSP